MRRETSGCAHEHEDGHIEIRHAGNSLPYRVLFDRHPHVTQGAVVTNKRLGVVLGKIRRDQQERDRQRLAGNLTLRQKRRIRAAVARADAAEML